MVAGYIDKIRLEPWSAGDWARFPNAAKVRIVKKASTNDGHVLDVEPGDATPAQAPGWARMRRQSGFAWPTIYCNLSTWPTVIQAFKDQGEPMPLWWIARYNGVKEFPTLQGQEAIAKQYAGDVAPGYDLSWVKDFWPGVDGVQDMPLANPDFKYLFYDNPIQEFSTVSALLANIKDNAKAAANLAGAINGLRDLIIADDANDVTADAVAAKVKAAISADVADAVNDALAHVQVPAAEVDNETLSQALISQLLARLAS